MNRAKEHGILISVDLADPALVGRIGEVFEDVVDNYAAIVFANEEEARAFTGMEPENAAQFLGGKCRVAAVKRGEAGSFVYAGEKLHTVSVVKANVGNTNGAGDMYAAGVLYGIARGYSFEDCGWLGSRAASLVVAQKGARIISHIDVCNF